MDDLKPCPFELSDNSDGHTPRVEQFTEFTGKPCYFVDCSCGARSGSSLNLETAIGYWNLQLDRNFVLKILKWISDNPEDSAYWLTQVNRILDENK